MVTIAEIKINPYPKIEDLGRIAGKQKNEDQGRIVEKNKDRYDFNWFIGTILSLPMSNYSVNKFKNKISESMDLLSWIQEVKFLRRLMIIQMVILGSKVLHK